MSIRKNDEGFTGLEAAIVLIAFVVVAAVFSYVVLGAGFFTTQKSQEVVHTGVQQASSTLEVVGNVYGIASKAGSPIDNVNFSVALAPGGTSVDFSKVVMTYSNATSLQTLVENATVGNLAADSEWSIAEVKNQLTTDQTLEKGETFFINVKPKGGIIANDVFDISIQPSIGASLGIHRTAPASIQQVNILY